MPDNTFEPRIVGFLCNWCSYAGADLAGTSRLSYPPNIRIVRVPCSGRVDPLFVARALRDGADGVLVLGCHPGDCHYSEGNYHERRRFAVMHALLEFLGYERERVHLDWVSASEGRKFATVVTEFTETVRALGPARDPARVPNDMPLPARAMAPIPSAEAELRALAASLLADGRAEVVLGWEAGSVRPRPFFARTAEAAERLVMPPPDSLNLGNYLRAQAGKKVAVVVRPNDARAIHILIHEGQLVRDDLFLIGVGADDGRGPLPAAAYDAVLGPPLTTVDPTPGVAPLLDELERWPVKERAAFWTAQFEKCERCYACRQACPLCYCQTCLSEQLDPAWQSIAIETDEKMFFHAMRAYHLAGRCGGCDACSSACPVGVPLYLLNQKVAREVARMFDGYAAGLDPAAELPLSTFRKDEQLEGSHA